MNTKKEIVDKTYFLLGEDQSATVFDKEGEVIPELNTTIDEICRCKVSNINTWQAIKGGMLDFLVREKRIKVWRPIVLSKEIDENSTEIEVNTTDKIPEAWALCINGNIIKYDGKDEKRLHNVVWINGIHEVGSQILPAFEIKDEVIKIHDVIDDRTHLPMIYRDYREEALGECYTIKSHRGRKYVVFHNYDWIVTLSMTVKLEIMENDDDECGFPDEYGVNILPYLVAGRLLINTSEVAKGKELLAIGYNKLEDMYSFYATPSKPWRKTIKSKTLKLNHW